MQRWPLSAMATAINQAANTHQLAGQNSLLIEITALLFVFDWDMSHINKYFFNGTNSTFRDRSPRILFIDNKIVQLTDQLNLAVFCLEYNAEQFVPLLSRAIFLFINSDIVLMARIEYNSEIYCPNKSALLHFFFPICIRSTCSRLVPDFKLITL